MNSIMETANQMALEKQRYYMKEMERYSKKAFGNVLTREQVSQILGQAIDESWNISPSGLAVPASLPPAPEPKQIPAATVSYSTGFAVSAGWLQQFTDPYTGKIYPMDPEPQELEELTQLAAPEEPLDMECDFDLDDDWYEAHAARLAL